MQLTLATLENRPTRKELWIYDDAVVINGSLQIGNSNAVRKVRIAELTMDIISSAMNLRDWEDGKAICVTLRDFQAGDLEELTQMVDIDPAHPELGQELQKNGYVVVHLSPTESVRFPREQWTGEAPNISVPQEIINAMDQSKSTIKVQSIVNGDLVTWQ